MATARNILLITSDQQRWDTLGSVNDRIATAALDGLAREGTRFDRAYAPSPVCSPSRASIVTGLYPAWHGCGTIGVKLPEDVPTTIGDHLRERGFRTALIGKAHFQPLASESGQESIECQPVLRDLDFWREFRGPRYGFEHLEMARNHADESHVGQHYALWMEEQGETNWQQYFRPFPDDPAVPPRRHHWDLPEELHYSRWCADRTVAHIEQSASGGDPFFIWSSFQDPHPPYLVPEPWASMYDPRDMVPGQLVAGELDAMPPHVRLTREATPDYSRYLESGYPNHGFHSHLQDGDALRRDMAVY